MEQYHIEPQQRAGRAGGLRRWLPALLLLLLIASGYGLGLHRYLSLAALAENRDMLKQFVDSHLIAAVALYMVLYVAIVAMSIPVAAVMSIAGGLLFGWAISIPATVIAAVTGAVIVFEIVRTSFGRLLAERAGPAVQRLSRGFAENAFGVLLFLRLAPVFPFCAVNAVSGLCRVPLPSFIAATAIGIIPGSIAFALIGSGLDGVIGAQMAAYKACLAASGSPHCSLSLEPHALLTPELAVGLAGLGVVALLPVAVKLWRGRPQ